MAQSILTTFQKGILEELGKNPFLGKKFYLTGGTALSEFYLHHRLSEDLDFFCEEEFKIMPIQSWIKKLSKKFEIKEITYRNQMGLHVFFLHRDNEVLKIDFNYYPFPTLGPKTKYKKVPVDSLEDIAVNKIQTIATQPRSRDFIDLYQIIKETGWPVSELKKKARNKFDWYVDSLQLGSRFLMVKELEDYPQMIIPFNMDDCKKFWLDAAKKLAGDILEKP